MTIADSEDTCYPIFSYMHSFNEFFFTKQLAHKYLEDDQALSNHVKQCCKVGSFLHPPKGSRGEQLSLAAACADLYW